MGDEMRLALLISGGGTTAEQILRACNPKSMGKSPLSGKISPVLLIASRERDEGAYGITKALYEGLDGSNIVILKPGSFPTPLDFGEAIIGECEKRGVDLIGQYGWLPLTPPNVIERFQGMMINQHPGPLDPGYLDFGGKGMYGTAVHAARLYFVRRVGKDRFPWTEVTAHRVTDQYDEGIVIGRSEVPIEPKDTPYDLQNRSLPFEHRLQIAVLKSFSDGTVEELEREKRLVLPGMEEEILKEAKRAAILLFR